MHELVVHGISAVVLAVRAHVKLAFAVVRAGSLTMPIQLNVSRVFDGGSAMRPKAGPLPLL